MTETFKLGRGDRPPLEFECYLFECCCLNLNVF
jgi:hypothetical protein